MTSSARADFRSATTIAKLVYFVFLLLPEDCRPRLVAQYIRLATGMRCEPDDLISAFEQLYRCGLVTYKSSEARKLPFCDRRYLSQSTPDWQEIHYLANLATQKNWWPSFDVGRSEAWKNWVTKDLLHGVNKKVAPEWYWLYIEFFRAMTSGPMAKRITFPLPDSPYPVTAVCWHLCDRLSEGWWLSAKGFFEHVCEDAIYSVIPQLLDYLFLTERNTDDYLQAVCERLKYVNSQKSDNAVIAACACCVWAANVKVLKELSAIPHPDAPAAKFAALCLDLYDERLDDASAKYAEMEADLSSVSSVPVALLGLVFAVREKALARPDASPAPGRCQRALEKLRCADGLNRWHATARENYEPAFKAVTKLVKWLSDAMFEERTAKPVDEREMKFALSITDSFRRDNYHLLATIPLADAMRMGAPKTLTRPLLKDLSERKYPNLFAGVIETNYWKNVIDRLADVLPKRATGAKKKVETKAKGIIGWYLNLFFRTYGDNKHFSCDEIKPVFRSARAATDGSEDKILTIKGVANEKYAECMTEADTAILAIIQKRGFFGASAAGRVFPEEIIKHLAGHPFVLASAYTGNEKYDIKQSPVRIEWRNCEMTTAEDKDGNLTLSFGKEIWDVVDFPRPTFVRTAPDAFVYYPMPKNVRNVIDVFAEETRTGSITVPKSAIEKTKGVLARLAAVMPVAGSFAQAGNDAFTRVAASSQIHARLAYDREVLQVTLVVEPMSENAVPACAPGEGLAERLVQLRTGNTVLLARDLKAETAAAQAVRTAMEDFDAWSTGKNKWSLDDPEAALDALRTLKSLDAIQLDWPEGEKVRVTSPSAKGFNITASGTDWFEIKGNVKFDDGRVIELMKLLGEIRNRQGSYVRLGENDYLHLTNDLIRRMEALASVMTTGGKGGKATRIAPAALPMLMKEFKHGKEADGDDPALPQLPQLLMERAEALRAARERPVEVPRRLCATLRYYQETGFKWLEELSASGFGACLADDMGLGKTVQIIALLLNRSASGPSLVVAPASVCVNWVREIERFAPSLHTVTVWGQNVLPKELGAADVVICSYGILVSRDEDFAAREWNGIVLDEAQSIKNADTQRAQVACSLKAKFRVAATGTPVENRLLEFWSIFSFLNPGLLGTQKEFTSRFTEGGFATKSLKRIVEPFVMRRLKRDVLQDLPEKIEVVKHVALDDEERNAYEALRRDAVEELQSSGEAANRISILAALTRLRRFCCHPSLVLPAMPHSSKLDAVAELLEELREGGHRALVFSQFVDYLKIVREMLDEHGWSYCYLDGTTSAKDRAAAVDAFQRGEGDFFLISLKAGGTGLNLTAANDVVLLDPWWNPAVEDQAADRAHRIGQTLPVTVHRIVTEGTVEDRILDLHADKRAVSEDMLSSAKGAALTPDRLMALFG